MEDNKRTNKHMTTKMKVTSEHIDTSTTRHAVPFGFNWINPIIISDVEDYNQG